MGRIFTFIVGFVVGGICIYGGQRYHIVRAPEATYFVPKMDATLSETYVDVREFTPQDWTAHPSLAAALVRDGKSHVLNGSVVETLGAGAESFFQSLRRP